MDNAASIKAKLQKYGFALSNISGISMRPLIWGGEHCVAIVALDHEPKVGDILVFEVPLPDDKDKRVVHRLVEIREAENGGAVACNCPHNSDTWQASVAPVSKLYITRGDNCIGCEEVRREQIIGRVAEVHRLTGWRPWHIIPRKKFAVTDRSYRLYSRLWMAIWPLRRFLYRVRGKLAAMARGEK